MNENGKKVRKRLRIKGVFFLLFIFLIIGLLVYYLFTMPVKSISVINNHLLTEKEVIEASKIELDSSLFKTFFLPIKNNIKSLALVDDVKIKKDLLGHITITVYEDKVLFYNSLTEKIHLKNGSTLDANIYLGYPSLVNYVPSEIFDKFTEAFAKIDDDIIRMISEIVYDPDIYNDTILDEDRFLLRMNDGNLVYINTVNIEKLNRYQTIYASVGSGGTL